MIARYICSEKIVTIKLAIYVAIYAMCRDVHMWGRTYVKLAIYAMCRDVHM